MTSQFAAIFDKIHIPTEIVKSVLKTLKNSHKAKKEYYEDVLKGLRAEYDKLENRLEKMYEHMLDGRITEEEHDKRANTYRIERDGIKKKIESLEQTDDDYYIKAKYVFNLANKAPEIFKSSDIEVKRKLIKLVCQNPTMVDGTLSAPIRKPFSMFAKGPSVRYGVGDGF